MAHRPITMNTASRVPTGGGSALIAAYLNPVESYETWTTLPIGGKRVGKGDSRCSTPQISALSK